MAAEVTIHQALAAVMDGVGAVGKDSRNQQQGFNFRGIDAVVNAVGPELRKHGVITVPVVEDVHYETIGTKSGGTMRQCTLRVRWEFHGPKGDHLAAVVMAEAMDSGDKATSKAHSVSYRTALLQVLCIPTDDPDPDATTYERAGRVEVVTPDQADQLRTALNARPAADRTAFFDQFQARPNALPAARFDEAVAWVDALEPLPPTPKAPPVPTSEGQES